MPHRPPKATPPSTGLKCEWSTIKDGKLMVGSTGKERTDDDGNVVHRGELWVKTVGRPSGSERVFASRGRPPRRRRDDRRDAAATPP